MTSSKTKNERIGEKGRMTRERHSTMDCHVYTLKIDQSKLSTKQKEELKMMFVEGKRLKNYILSQCMDNQTKLFDYPLPHANEKIQYKDKDGNLIDYKLRHLGSQMTQDVLNDMKSNLKTIIKLTKAKKQRHGKLRFCSELKSLSLRQFGVTYKFHGKSKIKIQGVSGKVRINGTKQFWNDYGVEFANAKLLNKPDGLYVAVTTYKPKEKKETNLIKGGISIDMGCQTTIAYSDGRKENISIGESEHLKTLQRGMQRQVKGSNNRYKTIKNIRKEYQKLENKKNDIINKVIHDLKNYEYVVIQDEQVSKWLKNKHLSKRVHRACLGKLKEKIKNLDNVVVLAEDIPTTKICMNCGKVHEMNLSNRTFKCSCGCDMDRDVHAAQNMLGIVDMFNKFMNFVPVGRRDIKRVEFLEAYAKKFKVSYETAKHEAHGLSDRG